MVEQRACAVGTGGREATHLLQADRIVIDRTTDQTFRILLPSIQISMPHTINLRLSPDLQAPYPWRKPSPDRMLLSSEIPNARLSTGVPFPGCNLPRCSNVASKSASESSKGPVQHNRWKKVPKRTWVQHVASTLTQSDTRHH